MAFVVGRVRTAAENDVYNRHQPLANNKLMTTHHCCCWIHLIFVALLRHWITYMNGISFSEVWSQRIRYCKIVPDYLVPDGVTGQGHGKSVEWWTLGVLMNDILVWFPPIFDDEPMMTYRKIIQGKVGFSRFLLFRLLQPKEIRRLGVIKGGISRIRKHCWFEDFKWISLRQQTLKAPSRQKIKSPKDMSNSDLIAEKEDFSYTSNTDIGWDQHF